MITSLDNLKKLLGDELADSADDDYLLHLLKSLEITIRAKTNNTFIDRNIKACCIKVEINNDTITSNSIDFVKSGFREGNTILINKSLLNDGLYTITTVTSNSITVDETLIDEVCDCTMIGKVSYPYDLVDGIVKLIKYDLTMGDKLGIKSETISRHSVTYYDMTSTETLEGYPASLLGFIYKYRKMRV